MYRLQVYIKYIYIYSNDVYVYIAVLQKKIKIKSVQTDALMQTDKKKKHKQKKKGEVTDMDVEFMPNGTNVNAQKSFKRILVKQSSVFMETAR